MDETTNQILQRVDALAAKLQTTAEHLYGVLVHQAYISAASDIFWYLVTIGVWTTIYLINRRWAATAQIERERDRYERKTDIIKRSYFGYALLAFTSLGALIMFKNVGDTLTKLLNPEFWAVQTIIQQIK